MEAEGLIKVKEGFELLNPVMDVQGIFEDVDEDGVLNFKYIVIHFTSDDRKGTHSRYWEIEEGVTVEEFISNHEALKKLK